MGPDTRESTVIRAGLHAVAHLYGHTRLVRGIDRFTQLPTRERAAVVWVADRYGMKYVQVPVALEDITLHPGADS